MPAELGAAKWDTGAAGRSIVRVICSSETTPCSGEASDVTKAVNASNLTPECSTALMSINWGITRYPLANQVTLLGADSFGQSKKTSAYYYVDIYRMANIAAVTNVLAVEKQSATACSEIDLNGMGPVSFKIDTPLSNFPANNLYSVGGAEPGYTADFQEGNVLIVVKQGGKQGTLSEFKAVAKQALIKFEQ